MVVRIDQILIGTTFAVLGIVYKSFVRKELLQNSRDAEHWQNANSTMLFCNVTNFSSKCNRCLVVQVLLLLLRSGLVQPTVFVTRRADAPKPAGQ